jgi:thiosulfate/3-mercaptopyruvate sulfurtransferase
MSGSYARPDTLVGTSWVADHLSDPKLRFVEVDVDTSAYQQGHISGAVGWNWTTQLCDTQVRDIIPRPQLEALLAASGIDHDTTIVLYGDNNNWFAAWAFWQLKVYGHPDVRIMDGGRRKWLAESRELSTDAPKVSARTYTAADADLSLRAFLSEVQAVDTRNGGVLVDVRSPQEFTGEILAPPGLPDVPARRPHPRRAQHSVGQGVQ